MTKHYYYAENNHKNILEKLNKAILHTFSRLYSNPPSKG